jgi:ribosomal protein S18 acetylase RimI-like enzyme
MLPPSDYVMPMRMSDLPEVADLDAAIFGVKREKILATYLAEAPERGFLVRDGTGQIAGFLVVQEQNLGPWAAQDVTHAKALLAAAQRISFQTAPRALVPAQNTNAIKLLTRCGFNEVRRQYHMQRGSGGVPGNRAKLYGQISLAIG